MKANHIIIGCVLLVSSISSYAQVAKQSIEVAPATSTKIEKKEVPAVVMEAYSKEYPVTTYESWHGYPEFADESDWYGYDPYLYSRENPKYYIVEFTKNKTHHKVIYSAVGKKIATHISISSKIQKAIATSLIKSEYRDWKIVGEKEEIFKASDNEKISVYKIEVQLKNKKHYLFYKADGTLIKDREIKS